MHGVQGKADGRGRSAAEKQDDKRGGAIIFQRRFVPKVRPAKSRLLYASRVSQDDGGSSELSDFPSLDQFRVKVTLETPGRRLFQAVLVDGVRCALGLSSLDLEEETAGMRKRRDLLWVKRCSMQMLGFGWLAELLGYDAGELKKRILEAATHG